MTQPPPGIEQPITVTMNAQGRIVIPAQIRQRLEWEPGATLVIDINPDVAGISLATPRAGRDELRRRFAPFRENASERPSDELIRDRRFEASIEHLDADEQRRLRRARDA